jgi:cytochrome P450
MKNFDEIDIFTDLDVVADPYPYLEFLRGKGVASRVPGYNVVAVTGYDEGLAVFRDEDTYSSVVASGGALFPFNFTPADDLTDQIAAIRPQVPGGDTILTADPPEHTRIRTLLMGIITPKRVKENEASIRRMTDELIDKFIERGAVELFSEFASPLAALTVADLLGVPPEDYDKIIDPDRTPIPPGQVGVDRSASDMAKAMEFASRVRAYFTGHVDTRRTEPRHDVMSEIAKVRYSDGSLPPVSDVVSLAHLLFVAGEDTTSRVTLGAMRWLAEDGDLQKRVRAHPELIPSLIEESVRLDGPGRAAFRMAKRPGRIGELDIAPGTVVMLLLGAMNRDPRRFQNPSELQIDRKNVHEHLAFARGIHSCVGAPVARAEVKIALERLLDRLPDFRIDEAKHGPAGSRRYNRIPSYFVQGLDDLYLTFDKA